jgi:hypothetical protein
MPAPTRKHRTTRRRGRFAPLAALCAAALLAGCANRAPVETTGSKVFLEDDMLSAAVRGGDNGLELRWWVCSDRGDEIARVMAPYIDQPTPFGGELADRWRENGLRLVRVPLDDMLTLRRELPLLGRVDRHWLGQIPRWTELLQGDTIASDRPLYFQGRRASMETGRLRLLARAWTAPTLYGPRLRVDLTLQHVPQTMPFLPGFDALDAPSRLPAEMRGEVFTELTANMTLDPGYAYLIIPEDPMHTWTSSGAMRPAAWFDWGEIAGPPAPPLPTLGEALLTTMGMANTRDRELRAIVMLVPRTPDRFALLP